jgi:hypothetical protein
MPKPNYFDLSGNLIRIGWYPQGRGGPIMPGNLVPNTPMLIYSRGSLDVSVTGSDLTVTQSPAGTFVTAVVKKGGIIPGGITSMSVLIPDADVSINQCIAIHTVGVVSVHRGTAQLGPGQLETYTTIELTGTAAIIILPA